MANIMVAVISMSMAACRDNEDATLCAKHADCGSGLCLVAQTSQLAYCADFVQGCPVHLRWADTAGDELAGQCVVIEAPADAGVSDAVDAATGDAP